MIRLKITCLLFLTFFTAWLYSGENVPAGLPVSPGNPGNVASDKDKSKNGVTVHIISQSHIDVMKYWRYDPETIETSKVAFLKAIDNLEKFKDYFFTASQVPIIEPFENRYPELWKKIEKYIKSGRIEVAGGGLVEFAGIGPCGESIVRQFLYGKDYYKKKFGIDVKMCWHLKANVHPSTLPQILKLCGIKSYFFSKGNVPGVFSWEGIDGSRIIAVNPFRLDSPGQLDRFVGGALQDYQYHHAALIAGPDGYGGGLTTSEIGALEKQFGTSNLKCIFSRADRFVDAIEKEKLPNLKGEVAAELPGLYTTSCDIKEGNRTAENLLMTAERFATVSSRYQPYPAGGLRMAWNMTLFNQSRNIFGGTVVPSAGEVVLDLYRQVEQIVKPVFDNALQGIISHIDTRGFTAPIVVFNPLSWERDGVVMVPAPQGDGEWIVQDVEGGLHSTQVVYDSQKQAKSLLFEADKLPPFGYRLYSLIPSPHKVANPCIAESWKLETSRFKITFNPSTGNIEQAEAKPFLWKLLTGKGNEIQVLQDLGDSDGNIDLTGKSWKLGPLIKADVIERGPVRVGIRLQNRLIGEHTSFVREIYLTAGIPWIDFRTHIDWNSEKKMVKVAFPLAVGTKKSTWEVPYGYETRPNDGMERGALKWVDVSDNERGVSLLNLNRYGYDVQGNVIRLSLLRSPTWPAHNDEGGGHLASYALYPHLGTCHAGKVWQKAYEYNIPLIAIPVASHSGALPAQTSFFWLSQKNIMISAIKLAEKGNGIVLRLVEMEGRATSASLFSYWFLRGVYEINLLEQEEKKISTVGDSVKLDFRAHEIKTILLKSWGFAPLK